MLIEDSIPRTWHDLQLQVSQIFNESGYRSVTDMPIETARDTVNVDVYAEDPSSEPVTRTICECKYWTRRVPKSVVHSFMTIMTNSGANSGLIISSTGFQAGARQAIQNTNISLQTWTEFQENFAHRWIKTYMLPRLEREVVNPLFDYTEPFIGARVARAIDATPNFQMRSFEVLVERYAGLTFLALNYTQSPTFSRDINIQLPLREAIRNRRAQVSGVLPDDVLDAKALRPYLNAMCKNAKEAYKAFTELFVGRKSSSVQD